MAVDVTIVSIEQKQSIQSFTLQRDKNRNSAESLETRGYNQKHRLPTCEVYEDVAAVIRQEALGARRAGRQPSSQNT